MRRRTCWLAVLLLALACGRSPRGIGPQPRNPAIARPLEVYHNLGMLAGPYDFPAVARFATIAGPADSTYVLLNMSMPNSAIRFQRDESAFAAEYRVSAEFFRDSTPVSRIDRRERVRVSSFAETSRVEESILFQDVVALPPGTYTVQLQVADLHSSRGFRARDTVLVPAYPRDARMGTPMLIYAGTGRTAAGERPRVITNPRNTIPYGADTPHVYIEVYGAAQPQTIGLRVVDDDGVALWETQAAVTNGSESVRSAVVDVPGASLPIGRHWLETYETTGAQPHRTPLLVTISDQWMVANFDDVLEFLELIAYRAELDSLRKGTGPERRASWERFWAKRDPLPATPINEFREQFFERVKIATDEFSEGGRVGWETDRGQVFIVFGPPDHSIELQAGRETNAQMNLIEWLYEGLPGGRLVLQFYDRTGFGRYELTEPSETAFHNIAARIRPRN